MRPVVEFKLPNGETVLVEVDATIDEMGPAARTRGDVIEKAQETFEAAIGKVKQTAGALVETLRDLAASPDEIQVEFGFKADVKGNFLVASASGEANFKVALKWKNK